MRESYTKIMNIITLLIMFVQFIISPVLVIAETTDDIDPKIDLKVIKSGQEEQGSIELEKGDQFTLQLSGDDLENKEFFINLSPMFKIVEESQLSQIPFLEVDYNELENKLYIHSHEKEIQNLSIDFSVDDTGSQEISAWTGSKRISNVLLVSVIESQLADNDLIENENKETPNLRVGNLSLDVDLDSQQVSVLSGDDISLNLTLKTTGIFETYHNVDLIVDLSEKNQFSWFENTKENLERLEIADVIPEFVEKDDTNTNPKLKYHFDKLDTGQLYRKTIDLKTAEGIVPNNTEVKTFISLKSDETPEFKDEATVLIEASSPIKNDIDYVGTIKNNENVDETILNPKKNDLFVLRAQTILSPEKKGTIFLKDSSFIVIKVKLDDNLEYVGDKEIDQKFDSLTEQTGEWSEEEKTISFKVPIDKFNVDNLAEYDFIRDIIVKPRPNTSVPLSVKASISASADYVTNDIPKGNETKKTSIYVISETVDPPSIQGSLYHSSFYGQSDGNGTIINEPNPTTVINDTDIIRVSGDMSPSIGNDIATINDQTKNTEDFADYLRNNVINESVGYKTYTAEYEIPTDKMIFNYLSIGNPILNPIAGASAQPLPRAQSANIEIELVDGTVKTIKHVFPAVPIDQHVDNMVFNREDFGLTKEQLVKKARVTFIDAPGGITVNPIILDGSAIEGATGKVNILYRHYGTFANGANFTKAGLDNGYNPTSNMGARGPTIAPPVEPKRIVASSVQYLENKDGVINLGKNKLQVKFTNLDVSNQLLKGQFQSIILLPRGALVNENDAPDFILHKHNAKKNLDNTKYEVITDEGKQKIKIDWPEDVDLSRNNAIEATFPIEIQEYADSSHQPIFYTTSTVPFTKSNSETDPNFQFIESITESVSVITDTFLELDTNDINDNDNKEEVVVRTGNQYYLIADTAAIVKQFVKGNKDNDFIDSVGRATNNGNVEYKLEINSFSNVDNFMVIDRLPSVGDISITDIKDRESKFDISLSGPVEITGAYADYFQVFYSREKNPSVKELMDNVRYPSSTTEKVEDNPTVKNPNWQKTVSEWSEIHSFKIVLKEGKVLPENSKVDFIVKGSIPSKEITYDLTNPEKDIDERAAWNSFAYVMNNEQIIEPAKVGVVVDPPQITAKKLVNGVQTTQARVGDVLTYTIKGIHEKGSGQWEGSLSDTLPEHLTYVANSTTKDGVAQPDTVWQEGVLTIPEVTLNDDHPEVEVTFQATINAGALGTQIKNTGHLIPAEPQEPPVPTPPTTTEVVYSPGELEATKGVFNAKGEAIHGQTVRAGDIIEYRITAANPKEATTIVNNVIVKDTIPANLSYQANSLKVTYPDGKTADLADASVTGQQLTTVNLGSLKGQESLTVSFKVKVNPEAKGSLVNVANVTGTTPPVTPGAPEEPLTPTDPSTEVEVPGGVTAGNQKVLPKTNETTSLWLCMFGILCVSIFLLIISCYKSEVNKKL
ncbi:DUF11 domain-containing protein [Vagococcus acidifermentans]|uniref:DUF11 domain-containing protein n=1 Tax=Vagococcus acidifermentans TaxID=564710 RepID=A0A430AUL4_9ENTE|nr:DUF11 domain-containing protein [Vagococcus acidifermentans]RSU11744.1 hypothetical protein CBF27_07225 [Vagococcus acidifermentans]